MLELRDISIRYKSHKTPILSNINLTLVPGTITSIVGLSGCGKTTLLSSINGVLKYDHKGEVTGSVLLNKRPIESDSVMEISKYIGTVYQDPDSQIVFSSVRAELSFALENYCYPLEEIESIVTGVAKSLDMMHLLDRNPNELSGGEKQLVVLAAIMVLEPDVLLLDEIMSQVDDKGSDLIKKRILSLKEKNKIILMIEHDLDHLDIADRVMVLRNGLLETFDGELL
ncbi:ABC transporter ATP-binding protein [Acidaminobacter sp. JC074]|uniref:ABC transporter ATP-binding protein n=1 Tax=Acidaminobacter sp. JC074 TaxID=2530199 RepID=UPI001F0D2B4F|nr:ABC transporter ATP-binding protein [Acidaminobacter sp. JC074]MCH4888099.1 ABC transporter ATP-binding protein [Acidaminobacter sp. JC074]